MTCDETANDEPRQTFLFLHGRFNRCHMSNHADRNHEGNYPCLNRKRRHSRGPIDGDAGNVLRSTRMLTRSAGAVESCIMSKAETTNPDYEYTRGCLNTYRVVLGWTKPDDVSLRKLLTTQIEVEETILRKIVSHV